MGPCSLVSSSWMPTTSWGGLFPHRDLTISTNPGGGASHWPLPSSHSDSACWVVTSDGLAAQVLGVCFECPMLWAAMKVPLVWSLWLLLWLLSLWLSWSGCSSSVSLDGVIICKLDGWLSSSTCISVKWPKVPWPATATMHLLLISRVHLGVVAGLFPSNAGPWLRPGSSWAAPIYNPGPQNTCP